jgi:hypothetical protein
MEMLANKSGGASSEARVPGDADFTPNPDRAIWIEGKFT